VLVVEDDPATPGLLELVVRLEGYAATGVESALGAAAIARGERPCAVLLDLALPFRSGASLLDALKDDPATVAIPVIIVSAPADATASAHRPAHSHRPSRSPGSPAPGPDRLVRRARPLGQPPRRIGADPLADPQPEHVAADRLQPLVAQAVHLAQVAQQRLDLGPNVRCGSSPAGYGAAVHAPQAAQVAAYRTASTTTARAGGRSVAWLRPTTAARSPRAPRRTRRRHSGDSATGCPAPGAAD
jgi:CheY-like chemotaxis protein